MALFCSNVANGRSRQKKTPLLTVACLINKTKTDALYDTGADCCLIDPLMVRKLRLTKRVHNTVGYEIQGAFGKKGAMSRGEINLSLTIGTQRFQHLFIVAKLSDPTRIILGEARLTLNGLSIPVAHNYSETDSARCLQLDPYGITGGGNPSGTPNVKDRFKDNSNIVVGRRVCIGPHSFAAVKVLLPKRAPVGFKVHIECRDEAAEIDFPDQFRTVLRGEGHRKHGRTCATKAEGCTTCIQYKFLYIKVYNDTGGFLTLEPGRVVGKVAEATKLNEKELRRACAASVGGMSMEEVNYSDPSRIRRLLMCLNHPCPDNKERFTRELISKVPRGRSPRGGETVSHRCGITSHHLLKILNCKKVLLLSATQNEGLEKICSQAP